MHLFIRCFIMCAFSCFVYHDLCLMLHVRVSCVCVPCVVSASRIPWVALSSETTETPVFSQPYLGSTVALMLFVCLKTDRQSVVCTECIVAKWCILEQKLLLTAYRKSYMRNRLVPK